MANINVLAPFILSWEGGFSNHPADRGGATNKGVTMATWRQMGYDKDGDGDIDVTDLRQLTDADVVNKIMKPHYWDRWHADDIQDQSVANMVVDWVWSSGRHGITNVQSLLGVDVDGIVGKNTLTALNAQDPYVLFSHIKKQREKFIEKLVRRNPSQKVFRAGWLRRISYIKYGSLIYNTNPPKEQFF